ncbi:MAG: hypothetical protein HPZ91_01925 [Lentisphaeria bacterium]|nr:hypothetical protein [Lentisphaeria bacterium]
MSAVRALSIFLGLLCVTGSLRADRLMKTAEDREREGRIGTLLWKEAALSSGEARELAGLVRHPHEEVASHALVVAVVREVPDLERILETAQGGGRTCSEIAGRVRAAARKGSVVPELIREFEGRQYVKCCPPQPDDYLKDIIVCSLLRAARRSGKKPEIPGGVVFSPEQMALLNYGWKPSAQAFSYLCAEMGAEDRTWNRADDCLLAMCAYEKVFFDEAVEAISDEKTKPRVRKQLRFYLQVNRNRISEVQRGKANAVPSEPAPHWEPEKERRRADGREGCEDVH